jgi:hypothetical protein
MTSRICHSGKYGISMDYSNLYHIIIMPLESNRGENSEDIDVVVSNEHVHIVRTPEIRRVTECLHLYYTSANLSRQ